MSLNQGNLLTGSRLSDNDPRMGGRVVVMERWLNSQGTHVVCYREGNLRVVIRTDRIHDDDKKRRTGFNLIRCPECGDSRHAAADCDNLG